jgi:hypothetical protein
MKPGCIGQSNTKNLPAPTDLTKNPYGKKKLVFKDATQKSATLVVKVGVSYPYYIITFRVTTSVVPSRRS